MAKDGPSALSVMGVKTVPEGVHGGIPERNWVSMLGLTCNQRLPFGGLDALTWENIISKSLPRSRGIHTVLGNLVWQENSNFTPDEGLTLATAVVSHADTKLFDRFFSMLRRVIKTHWSLPLLRRLLFRVPSYEDSILKACRSSIKRTIQALPLP